jgi:hypothetical protein
MAGSGGLLIFIGAMLGLPDCGCLGTVRLAAAESDLERDFVCPPRDCRPLTWFHFMGNSITKEGIRADLEAIRAAQIQGIHVFTTGTVAAVQEKLKQSVRCLSPEWEEMMRFTADECRRLGLTLTFENCPGWGTAGGPWNSPSRAMRRLTWSTTAVEGGRKVAMRLPMPPTNPGQFPKQQAAAAKPEEADYRAVAVLAFPTPRGGEPLPPPKVAATDGDPTVWSKVFDGDTAANVRVKRTSYVTVAWERPVTVRSISFYPFQGDANSMKLASSDDGKDFRAVCDLAAPQACWLDWFHSAPITFAIPETKARYFRLSWPGARDFSMAEIVFDKAARLENWEAMAGLIFRDTKSPPLAEYDPSCCLSSARTIDLSKQCDAEGNLRWEAPVGRWTILRVAHVNPGYKNAPTVPEATGFECDKFTEAATFGHFDAFIGRLTAKGGPAGDGKTDGVLMDSWEANYQNWSDGFLEEFRKRRGYDPLPYLPAMAGLIVDDPTSTWRFLRDVRQTIDDLLVENFFGAMGRRAASRGMKMYIEEATGDVLPGDVLRYYSVCDRPMTEFWYRGFGDEMKPVKNTVSAAALYGKPLVTAEAYTQLNVRWDEHPFLVKARGDYKLAQGINQFAFHTFPHNPVIDAAPPGPLFCGGIGFPCTRGQTWWKHAATWTDYLARCQYLLRQGHGVADVLYFFGEDLDRFPMDDLPGLPRGYQFELLNADLLQNRLAMQSGRICPDSGGSYRLIVLRNSRRMTLASLAKLRELVRGGAIVLGDKPQFSPSLADRGQANEKIHALADELWGAATPASGEQTSGEGKVIWGRTVEQVLSAQRLEPDVVLPEKSLLFWNHRRTAGADIYFVANPRAAEQSAVVGFRVTGKQPELWAPESGHRRVMPLSEVRGPHTYVPLRLADSGSVFVVFRHPPSAGFRSVALNGKTVWDVSPTWGSGGGDDALARKQFMTNPSEMGRLQMPALSTLADCEPLDETRFVAWKPGVLDFLGNDKRTHRVEVKSGPAVRSLGGPWRLRFTPGWDTPRELELASLRSWTEFGQDAVRHYSGTATYHTTFEVSAKEARADAAMLDLGQVGQIAEVVLNQQPAGGALWTPPFRVDLAGKLKPGTNVLEVRVTNTWRNRLLLDATLPPAQRKTWTTSYPKGTDLVPSGLLGPVELRLGVVVKP